MEVQDSPICQTEAFDIIGLRKDGGVDTVIVCGAPLDNSALTLERLELKARNYLREISSNDFVQEFGPGPVRIFVSCSHDISTEAGDLINHLANEAAQQGVQLQLGEPVA